MTCDGPLLEAVAQLTGMRTAEPVKLDPRVTLVALAFALVGSYAGAPLRRALGTVAGGGARAS